MRALLLENLHPLASTILTEAGIEVESRAGALSEDELVAALERFDLLGIRSKTEVSARVLAAQASDQPPRPGARWARQDRPAATHLATR